jgi:F420 biosynthesis protein FbiB-like protein
MGETLHLIRQRRTVRKVRPDPVPPELIDAIIEAACWAPSAHNSQPWRFAVVRTSVARERLAQVMGEAFQEDLEADGVDPMEAVGRVQASVARLSATPVVIVFCLAVSDLYQYPDEIRQEAESRLGVQSVAAAIQNLLLVATESGLGTGWMCAPMFCPSVVRRQLVLPDDWDPQALITVGWPAESPEPPLRQDQDDLVRYR